MEVVVAFREWGARGGYHGREERGGCEGRGDFGLANEEVLYD